MDETFKFTVENIETVLHQLYHDDHAQAEANKFLVLAQLSPNAWTFSWQLLHPSKSHEAQFFGASTLHMKISKNWNEVPGNQYEELRSKLLQTIFSYSCGPKVILTRLCIAMSSFVIHTITDFWPTAVADLMSALQPQNVPNSNPNQVAHVLLELLTILAEELNTVTLSQYKSHIVHHALQSSLKDVMCLVEHILSKNSPIDVCEIALKCYSSWSQFGSDALEYQPLLVLTFDMVYRDELCQTALETLTNIATHPVSHKFPTVILMMVDQIAKFESLLKEAAEKDMDKLCCIYAFILAVGENHTKLLLETVLEDPSKKDSIMKLVVFVLQCSSTPGHYPFDEICSEQSFGFWYTLQDGIVSSETRAFEKLLLIFLPIFQSLLDTYLVKLQYPTEEYYLQWNSENKESFRCYRQDIGDSIMFCNNILRQSALASLIAHLEIATNTANSFPNQWQYLEACLFAFKEMVENVDTNEYCYIPQFMAHLPKIPLTHMKVVSAAMEAVGACAEWINAHPDVMHFVLPLLLMGLRSAEMSLSATFALKYITKGCHTSLQPFAEQILVASQDALKGNVLKSQEKVRLMSTVGSMLSIMPYSYIMSYLDGLLSPVVELLQRCVQQKPSPPSQSCFVHQLNMLSMLFSTLDIRSDSMKDSEKVEASGDNLKENQNAPQPVLLILQKVIPIFSNVATTWQPSEQITEVICEALKRSVATLLDEAKPFVQDIVILILQLYRSCPHSAVLDMAKQLLLLFVTDESERERLTHFFCEICNHTILLTSSGFHENTTVLEIFLQLLSQVIKKAFIFFKSESLNYPVIFQCGVAALGLPERATVKAASSFITEFITHSREVPSMLNVINSQGEILLIQVLKVIGGESPRSVVEFMPDILISLNKKYFDNLCRWMNTFSQDNSFVPSRVTHQQREQFSRLVLKERTNKRKLTETVNEFTLLCRGLIGTEYAEQTIKP